MHHRLRQLEPLLHACGVSVNLAITLLAHPDKVQHFMRPLPRRLKRQAGQLGAISDVFASRHAGNVAILFRRVTHPLADVPSFAAHLASQQFGRSGGNGLQLEKALHKRALARAIGTKQADGTGQDLEADVIQGPLPPKNFGESLRFNDRLGSHVAPILCKENAPLAREKAGIFCCQKPLWTDKIG